MKNIAVYLLAEDFDTRIINNEALSQCVYEPCREYELTKTGFVPFAEGNLDDSGEESVTFVKQDSDFIHFIVKQQKKLIPSKKKLEPLIAKATKKFLENNQDRFESADDLDKDSLKAIEQQVMDEQLKHCFHADTTTKVTVDTKANLVYMDSAGYKSAEVVAAFIRSQLNTFPVIPLCDAVKNADVGDTLVSWIKSGFSEVITLGNYCKLEGAEKATHTVSNKSLYDAIDELSAVFERQYKCKEIALEHDGVFNYKLKSSLEFSSVRLNVHDKESSEDSNLLLVANAVRELVAEVIKEFGGL